MREDGARNEKFESNNDNKHLLNCMCQALCCEILYELIQLILKAIRFNGFITIIPILEMRMGSRLDLVSEKNRKRS